MTSEGALVCRVGSLKWETLLSVQMLTEATHQVGCGRPTLKGNWCQPGLSARWSGAKTTFQWLVGVHSLGGASPQGTWELGILC